MENETVLNTVALSTKDNPFDPFTQFDEWYAWDLSHNNHCCEILAKFARCSDELSDKENSDEIEYAIDQIIAVDPEHKFIKVTKSN